MAGLPALSMECRAGADPELRFGPSGTAVSRLRVCAQERKYEDGAWVDGVACWLYVKAFGKLAENIAESVQKGDLLTVVGRLTLDEWDDRQTGQKHSMHSVLADQVSVSLRFRTVRHGDGQAERSNTQDTSDPWSTPPAERPQQGAQQGGNQQQADEPPF